MVSLPLLRESATYVENGESILKHYSMGAQGAVEAHDVFSAHVEAILILKKAPVIAPSPFKGRGKRPQHRPQIPTRGEQVNAATAFVPQPCIGLTPTTHRTVAGNTAATFATHGAPSTFITISGDGSTLPLPPTPIADDTTNFSPPHCDSRQRNHDRRSAH